MTRPCSFITLIFIYDLRLSLFTDPLKMFFLRRFLLVRLPFFILRLLGLLSGGLAFRPLALCGFRSIDLFLLGGVACALCFYAPEQLCVRPLLFDYVWGVARLALLSETMSIC